MRVGTWTRRRGFWAAAATLTLLGLLLFPFLWARTAAAFSPGGERRALPVIMYHSLLREEARWGEYVVSPEQLERDLAYLKGQGFTFVSVAEVLEFVTGTGPLPEKPVLLTLDDGYLNNSVYLPEILERQDARAVVAVVGEYTDIFSLQEDHSPSYAHMTWDDLKALAENPRIELANHSYYFHHQGDRKGAMRKPGEHKNDWLAALRSDAQALQDALTARCGVTPRVYAYPYGQISDGADGALRRMGFEATLSCYQRVTVLQRGEPECLLSIGRYNRPAGAAAEIFFKPILEEAAP